MKQISLLNTFLLSLSSHCLVYAFFFGNTQSEASPVGFQVFQWEGNRAYDVQIGSFELDSNNPLSQTTHTVKEEKRSPLPFKEAAPVAMTRQPKEPLKIQSPGLARSIFTKKVEKSGKDIQPPLTPKVPPAVESPSPTKAYLSYFRTIREKIRQLADQYYKQGGEEQGEVSLYFVLDRNGTLQTSKIVPEKSNASLRLYSLALKSVERSSPYPSFPASLSSEELAFSVTILFQENN